MLQINTQLDNDSEIRSYYSNIYRAVEMLDKGDFNGLIIQSPTGFAKSYHIDNALKGCKSKSILFQGDISDAYLFKFLYEHREDYIIIFRDFGKILRNRYLIETCKHILDPTPERIIKRETYKEHEGIPQEFSFKSKVIIELNEIGKKYIQDIDAIKSRGIFIELNFSREELSKIMYLICKDDFDKEVTSYLLSNSHKLGRNSFNLRIHNRSLVIAKSSIRDKLDWKKQIDLFINTQESEIRKALYRLAGTKQVRRFIFIKYLMSEFDWSYPTAHRRLNEALLIKDLFDNYKMKQSLICLYPISEKNDIKNISETEK